VAPRPTPTWNLDAQLLADLTARGELQTLLDLVAGSTMWVDPHVAGGVRVVFPKSARRVGYRHYMGEVVGGIRLWANQPATEAFFAAIDSRFTHFVGAAVCHVYPNSPQLPLHFTRLANLFVVPAPLATLTEWEPVLTALKWRAFELFGYRGPSNQTPVRPPMLPSSWQGPTQLSATRLAAVLGKLRVLRKIRPMWYAPTKQNPAPESVLPVRKIEHARRLEQEFIAMLDRSPAIRNMLITWIVRHSYFAPLGVVKAIPNPAPWARRDRRWRKEKPGDRDGKVIIRSNNLPKRAILVALGAPVTHTHGAVVDHAWKDAPFLEAHFCALGGLVLVPQAFSSIVDLDPIRAVLQRHMFERTGYTGPPGTPPPLPAWMPAEWPENRQLSRAQEIHAIKMLKRHLVPPPKRK
jgi:hypothetical protein